MLWRKPRAENKGLVLMTRLGTESADRDPFQDSEIDGSGRAG